MAKQLSPKPPVVQQAEAVITMTFPEAMVQVIKGKKISRLDWKNTDYGLLRDGWLMIFRNGEFFVWKVSDGDLLAIDWTVLETTN